MLVRFIKFSFRGLIGTAIDTIVLFILSKYIFKGYFYKYLVAPAISFEIAILCTYLICYFWIWHQRVYHNFKDFIKRIPAYNGASLIAFGIKMTLLNAIAVVFLFDVVICNLIALCFSGLVNFFVSEKLIFRKRKGVIGDT